MSDDAASLSNLHDIVLPAPVSYWPPAPGWWIVAAALLALLLLLAVVLALRHRDNAYRRAALAELRRIQPPLNGAVAAAVSSILKRTALAAFPRAEVASLSGDAWLAFLDRTGRTSAFSSGAGRALPTLALGAAGTGDAAVMDAAVMHAARDWVRRHRPPEGTA